MKRKKRGNLTSTRIKTIHHSQSLKRPAALGHYLKNVRTRTWILWSIVLMLVVSGFLTLMILNEELPSLARLERIDPASATRVYSQDGVLLHSFFTSNRTYTRFDRIPPSAVHALLSMEDRDFYQHWGINLLGIVRAAIVDIRYMEFRQGGGTLTMQLTRPLFFGREQTIIRKIKEALTAIRIEKTYSKNEILEMYLNISDFGNNAFGIEAAARRYFDKDVQDLNTGESALLIGLLKGTSWYSPIRHPDRALKQRNIVMRTMVETGYLNSAQYDSLKQEPLNLKLNDPNKMKIAPYFTEYIRRQLNRMQDSLDVNIYEDGLRVYTSLNTRFQYFMEKAVAKHMDAIQARVRGQRDFKDLKEELGDSLFETKTKVELAFTALNPHNGQILAMIGGRDFDKSKFNRVTQARRQPGSAFKPFLYTAAIDNGYSPANQYLNQPTVEINPDGSRWTPENYDKSVGGLTTLRDALRRSINLVAVRLIADVGPRTVVHYARLLGLSTPVRPYSSLALGSSEVIPLELVSAYGTFANNGIHVKPVSILKIEDKNGNEIYNARPEQQQALSPETAQIMRSMMMDVVKRGTGGSLGWKYNFHIPAGGKTGTTNNYTDAWFVGYTPDIAAGIWVGLDDAQLSLGRGMTGASAALPFWGDFMSSVYDSVQFVHGKFQDSPGVVKLEICLDSRKLAGPYCPNTVEELFTEKNRPTEKCDIHTGFDSYKKRHRKSF